MKQENSKKLSEVLQLLIKENKWEDGLLRVRIFKTWDIVVGERVAQATINKFFKDGILYCTINSSMLRSQLHYQNEAILFNMNKMLSDNIINKIVIK